jgi:hypothetical protein
MKLTGLVVAMGLFGMGPGGALLDELKASYEKKRVERENELSEIVTPPGEQHHPQHPQHHDVHLLEGTLINPSSVQHRPTKNNNKLSQDVANEFVTHPFLPINTTSGRAQQLPVLPKVDLVVPPTMTPPPAVSSTQDFPWLSFMMTTTTTTTPSTKSPVPPKLPQIIVNKMDVRRRN